MNRSRRTLAAALGVLVLSSVVAGAGPAAAADPPSVRLLASSTTLTVARDRRDFVWVDPGAWIASVGGAFELRATRADYDSPVELEQVDATTGDPLRSLPADLLDGWYGLRDLVHISVRHGDDRPVLRYPVSFCPNTWNRQRLSDAGPVTARYPTFCSGGPFTRGMVWGIDDGWAVPALTDSYYGLGWKAERNRYRIRVWIDPIYRPLLGISDADAEIVVRVSVERGTMAGRMAARPELAYARAASVPDVTDPDPQTLPDLVALPAWSIDPYHDRRSDRDYLRFNATEWNAGPGTMVVEGFRDTDETAMDAYQYFYMGDEPVGRANIGSLEFHAGGGHDHWHFEEFTAYSLLDEAKQLVAPSDKQSWCLANTDAIDLAVPNANWLGYGGDLFTACGGPSALWVREILDVGWGDTYAQYVAGQAFDITDLPNGTYYIRVQVNPLGSMFESTDANNIEDRLVILKGKPGSRRVEVPPWHGIDTEGCCPVGEV
ncbi:MAG TPA: lysyl oxidase family protein [Actinomycetota bacterium]|nr:lysyl oxidase family protein [Actinomycetota bacterium]